VLDRGNYLSTGQMCTALSRILVPESRVSEVADALAERAQAHRIGDPLDEKTTLGPLVNRTQHERVLRYIGIAKDEGAKLVTGGRRPSDLPKGWYIEPTVFVDVANTMTVAREEVFGPVASIIAYRNEEEAIAVANDTPYGLSGAVLSSDEGHALEVARRIRTGTVGINRYGPAYNAPFGGVKRSGVGREHGPEGFDTFLEYQCYGIPESMAEELASRGLEREVLSVPEVPGRHAPWK
jgi:aldehyde dehydrogenase (NAD+)